MLKKYLGTTRDAYKVYDRDDSHIHFEGGITKELLKRAIGLIYANGTVFKKKEIQFKEFIGYSNCVSVNSDDQVIYAYRKGREGKTPMVKSRKPELCKTLTLIIRKDRECEDSYILVTCYVGEGSVREPWDKTIRTDQERKNCEEFWSKHAIIYNAELIDWERMKTSEN